MVSNLYTLTTILYPYNHSVFSLSVLYSVNYLKYSTFCYKIGFISPIGYCKFSENIWYFQIVVLEKTLETPLDCKKIKPVNPKGNQPWIFIERTDAEVEAPIFLPPDVKNWLTGKGPDAGKDWRHEETGMTEDEMLGSHPVHWNTASLTRWTRVWVNSGSWWWTGKPGMLQSMESQRVRHNWVTELNWSRI